MAANTQSKEMLEEECKYRETFDEAEAMRELEKRSALVRGHDSLHFYLYSMCPLSRDTLLPLRTSIGKVNWRGQ